MSLFTTSYFGGLGGFGGWMSEGFGIPIGSVADSRMAPAGPDAKARPLEPTQRPWTGIISLPGFFPGFDKAPPPSISLYWQMRRYSTIALAQAITVGPVLASVRTIEIADDKGDKALAAQMQDLATRQVLPFIEQAMAPGFECLHFGFWLQEVIWGRQGGYTIPVEARSFLPGETTIFRDPCRRFIGYQIGNHYRDARYALLTVNNPHIDPIFGESRNETCREEWWRARQSEENADKVERKAAGMQMGLGVPQGATFQDEKGNPIFPREMAENLVNAAVRGDCFTYPLTAFSKQDCLRNPALMDIPAVKVTQYDWGNNGPALAAHLSRISAIDTKIMMARLRPSREAMEGTSGTRAEAAVHGQIGVTDSELVAAQQLRQITAQVLDRWAVTNFGPKAAGMLVAKQAPLSDPQQQFLQDVYKALCGGQKPDPETLAQIDRRALGKRVEMPLLDERAVQSELAQQQATPSAQIPSPGKGTGNTTSESTALSANGPATVALADELTGGHWVTINGVHVYIRDGFVVAGPPRLMGRSHDELSKTKIAVPGADPASYYQVCFAAGTMVVMKGGKRKAIETIKPDEWVMAVPDTDPTAEPRPCRVLRVFHNEPAEIWHLKVGGQIIRTTANHPFYVKGKGWIPVATLMKGDQLRTGEGLSVDVTDVGHSGLQEPVFNLHVETANTYFACFNLTGAAVLVHNQSVQHSKPAKPDEAAWMDDPDTDVVAVLYKPDTQRSREIALRKGVAAYQKGANPKLRVISSVNQQTPTSDLVKQIMDNSKEGEKLKVVIVSHGAEGDGPEAGTPGAAGMRGKFTQLFSKWSDAVDVAQPHIDEKLSQAIIDEIAAVLFKDDDAKAFLQLKGRVGEITFVGCSIAADKNTQRLIDVIAAKLGAKIRAFKTGCGEFANQGGVGAFAESANAATNHAEFIYETSGGK